MEEITNQSKATLDMCVYQKLAMARVMLKNTPLKKSGKNKYANYDYFELTDYLPAVTDICHMVGILPVVSFDSDLATMKIYNCNKSEDPIVFDTPMSTADMKGCLEVQKLGAVQTYLRRYLYQNAFEIAENDISESQTGNIRAEDFKHPVPDYMKEESAPKKPSRYVKSPVKKPVDSTPIQQFSAKSAYEHILALCDGDKAKCGQLFKDAGAPSAKMISKMVYAIVLQNFPAPPASTEKAVRTLNEADVKEIEEEAGEANWGNPDEAPAM
ncbi:MAG: ERF family protein [Sphaerochaetaceae bacterium]